MRETLENIEAYFEESMEITKPLANFMNTYTFNLSGRKLPTNLIIQMASSDLITPETLENFISRGDVEEKLDWGSFANIVSIDKFRALLDAELLPETVDAFNALDSFDSELPIKMVRQGLVDFLIKQNIQPNVKWIDQFINDRNLNLTEFSQKYFDLFSHDQWMSLGQMLTDEFHKFEKLINQEKGAFSQTFDTTDGNEVILKWMKSSGFISDYSISGKTGKFVVSKK